MVQRFGISLTLLIAFLLVQGHNLIPHHHQEERPAAASHQHHHGHNHGHHHHSPDQDEGGDSEPFHGTHQADFGKVLVKSNGLKELLLKPSSVFILTQVPELDRTAESPPRIRPPFAEHIQARLQKYSVPLRAPPAVSSRI